jgi:hypothetical protein
MKPSYEERFWAKARKGVDCWEWTGFRLDSGYGRFMDAKRGVLYAHRVAYELSVGPIAPGLVVDHTCRNPSCVNPKHLDAVTQQENVRRSFWRAINAKAPTP